MNNTPTLCDNCSGTQEDLTDRVGNSHTTGVLVKMPLQILSATAMALAVLSSVFVLFLHLPHVLDGVQSFCHLPPWGLKSAVPLILIGVSYACLLFALQRTMMQRLLGLLVCIAFIGWGAEQFVSNPSIVSMIDDVVVFLFVLDLSLIIREHLKGLAAERASEKFTLNKTSR